MEAILILVGLAGVIWFFVGPFLFMSHANRIRTLTEDIQRLRKELDKRTTPLTTKVNSLADELHLLRGQERVHPTGIVPPPSSSAEVTTASTVVSSHSLAPQSIANTEQAAPITTHDTAIRPLPVALSESNKVASQTLSESSSTSPAEIVGTEQRREKRDTSDMVREFLEKRPQGSHEMKPADYAPPAIPPARSFNEMDASKWMSWVGAIAVMMGMGYFLKYTIEEQWLGPTGRVALGLLGGMVVFVSAAWGMKKDYRVLAEGLAGAAMGILYFSLFAAFQWYDLLPKMVAFGGMILVTAAGLSFAAGFNSLPTAILAMIGGFLTPFMLSKGGGNVSTLFTYILILDLGVLALATFRNWGSLHLLNFGGTLLIWLGWLANNYVPEDLWLTVAWITLFGVLFSWLGLWRHVIRRENSSTPDMALMLLTPIVYFGALYGLTKENYSNLHGLMAVLVAAYYIALGLFAFLRNPGNNQIVVTLVGVGLSFVTLAVPLQLTGHWIVIAWAVESLLLIEIGLRYEKPGFRMTGFALLAVVQQHMVMYALGTFTNPLDFTTEFVRRIWEDPQIMDAGKTAAGGVINGRSMSFLANAIVLAILSWEYRRREKSARIQLPESAVRLGITGPLPNAGQVTLLLIPLVPVIVLAMGLLETFVYGIRAHWHVTTHLSMLPIWLSFFALVTLIVFRRMNDVSTLGGLARGLYSITAILFIGFLFIGFPDWGNSPDPLWGDPVMNPRGMGFLMAFGAALFGANLFLRGDSTNPGNRSIATTLTVAVPFVLLGMCLTETLAYGKRHDWIWASHWSSIGIWLSLFTVGVLFASRRVVSERVPLTHFSRVLLAGLAGVCALLFLGTLADWNQLVRNGLSSAWNIPFLNPRGVCFLLAVWAALVGRKFSQQREGGDADSQRPLLPVFTSNQLAVLAYIIGFLMFTIEVFALGKQRSWGTATSLAITGTWASLAIMTIGAGFMKRSAPIRIMALMVFALTTAKVFLYDVWYLDRPIRVAAFMGLGVALFVGSFLYRRFNSQLKDWIKPMSLLLAAMIPLGLCGPLQAEDPVPDLSTQFSHLFPLESTTPPAGQNNVDSYFARIPLTPEIYAASRSSLQDLRLLSVDERGISTQIPYALISPTDEPGPPDHVLSIVKQSNTETITEFIVAAGEVSDPIESLQLKVTSSEREFVRTLRLFGANQPETTEWELLVGDGYIVDRTQGELRLTETTIACPHSPYRYYRFVIENAGQPPLSIKTCTAHHARRRVAARLSYPVAVKNEVRMESQSTRVELTLPGPVPIDRLEFELSGPEEYLRHARLFSIQDISTTPINSLLLFHLPRFAKGHTTSTLFPTQRTNRLRLEIENGDNPRLSVSSAKAFGIEEYLAVPLKSLQDAKYPVALYVGGQAGAPNYDLTHIHTLPDVEQMAKRAVLPCTPNSSYLEVKMKRPWAEENPRIVWVLVVGGVVILSGVAITLLKAAGEQPQVAATPNTDAAEHA